MLIEIDTVRRRQAEIEAELTSLRATTRAAETPGARLEVLKARADVLRTLSLVHARLARGEPENLARLADYRPPDSERLYVFVVARPAGGLAGGRAERFATLSPEFAQHLLCLSATGRQQRVCVSQLSCLAARDRISRVC